MASPAKKRDRGPELDGPVNICFWIWRVAMAGKAGTIVQTVFHHHFIMGVEILKYLYFMAFKTDCSPVGIWPASEEMPGSRIGDILCMHLVARKALHLAGNKGENWINNGTLLANKLKVGIGWMMVIIFQIVMTPLACLRRVFLVY